MENVSYGWKLYSYDHRHPGQIESLDYYSVETGEVVYTVNLQNGRWDVYSCPDDQIVGKVNTATANITRANSCTSAALDFSGKSQDDLGDGTTNKAYTATEKTKLSNVEDSATADMTGNEIVTAINGGSNGITREDALDQDSLNIVKTNPAASEFKVKAIHRTATGELDVEYDDVAV